MREEVSEQDRSLNGKRYLIVGKINIDSEIGGLKIRSW